LQSQSYLNFESSIWYTFKRHKIRDIKDLLASSPISSAPEASKTIIPFVNLTFSMSAKHDLKN
jgi:hypothetical protein